MCDISSKQFCSFINSRLQEWVEQNNITGKHQTGFKDHRTVDCMFTLLAAVQKQFANNGKLYVTVIDFEKSLIQFQGNSVGSSSKEWNSTFAIPL